MHIQPLVPARNCFIWPSAVISMIVAFFEIDGGAALIALAIFAASALPPPPLAIVSCPDFALGSPLSGLAFSWAATVQLAMISSPATITIVFRIVFLRGMWVRYVFRLLTPPRPGRSGRCRDCVPTPPGCQRQSRRHDDPLHCQHELPYRCRWPNEGCTAGDPTGAPSTPQGGSMARIPLVTRDQIVEKEQPAYDTLMRSRANRPNIGPYSLLLHMPEMAQRLEALRTYLRDEASLPPKLQELVMISVAREMSCAISGICR